MTQSVRGGVSETVTGVNYVNPQTANILKSNGNTNTTPTSTPINHGIFLNDIAQSHHFTVQLEGFTMYSTPAGSFSDFLPVRSLNYNYTSYENMSIPVAIFGDFPLLNRKRVSTLALSCFDMDNNKLEHDLRNWENSCFPNGRYVAYMEDVARKFTYRGYDVKGKETYNAEFYVIPSGNISTSRDYSANDAKIISFNLVCVGDGSTCATGVSRKAQPNQSESLSYNPVKVTVKQALSGDNQTIDQGFSEMVNTPDWSS